MHIHNQDDFCKATQYWVHDSELKRKSKRKGTTVKSFLIYVTEEMMVYKFSTFKFSNTQTGAAKITTPKITVDTSEKECNLLSNKFMDIGSTNEAKVHSSSAHHYISASAETTVGCKVPAQLYKGPS